MKLILLSIFVSASAILNIWYSNGTREDEKSPSRDRWTKGSISTPSEVRMKIKIGTNSFTASLEDNPSAERFRSMLPLTIKMTELNGNEKYADLPVSLPRDAANPGTIQSGDIMLYGSSTVVIFYKKFLTSYSYTKLGHIDDAARLRAALGSRDVTVSFE